MKSITFTIALFILSFMNLYSNDYTRFNDSTKTLEIIKNDKDLYVNIKPKDDGLSYSIIDSYQLSEIKDTIFNLQYDNYKNFIIKYTNAKYDKETKENYDENKIDIKNKSIVSKLTIENNTLKTVKFVISSRFQDFESNPLILIFKNKKLIKEYNYNENSMYQLYLDPELNEVIELTSKETIELIFVKKIYKNITFNTTHFLLTNNDKNIINNNKRIMFFTFMLSPILILIIVLIFGTILKEKIYFYYAFYVLSFIIFFLIIYKLYWLIFSNNISIFIKDNFETPIIALLLFSSSILFLSKYLSIKSYYRKWWRVLNILALIGILNILFLFFKLIIITFINNELIINTFKSIHSIQIGVSYFLVFIFPILNFILYIISIKIFNKGNKDALYIIVGWSFLIIVIILYFIVLLIVFSIIPNPTPNFIPGGQISVYIIAFGLFFEMFVFLFAIAKKTRQGQIDLAIEETERLLQEQEKKLILEAHKQLTAKNEEILSSMRYAGHLQSVVLPLEEKIQNSLPNNFIIFKPKDIVSGDFYWYADTDNFTFIGLGDCTGHGIPGSMLTMIGTMLLDQAVIQNNIYEIDQIIRFVNIQFIKSVNESKKTRDGMELAIIKIHKNSNKIEYSGLGINLYIISDEKLNEYKAKRASIGEDLDEIDVVELELSKNDKIYLFSDGYADQNNSGGKKYGKTKLKELITNSSNKSIKEQKNIIESELEKHKGTELQRDDVTIIGIEI